MQMAKRSDRKSGPRTPSGQLSRAAKSILDAIPPAALARQKALLLAGLGNPLLSTSFGQMHLHGKISLAEVRACLTWQAAYDRYQRAVGSVIVGVKMQRYERQAPGQGPGEGSEAWERMSEQDTATCRFFAAAEQALANCGRETLYWTRELLDADAYLDWQAERHAIHGIKALAEFFSRPRK